MATSTRASDGVGVVEQAIARILPVDALLDLADDAIEAAAADGDSASLEQLGDVLARAAEQRGSAGLAIAGERARVAAAALPLSTPTPAPAAVPPLLLSAEPEAAPAVVFAGWWRRFGAHVADWIGIFTLWGVAGEIGGFGLLVFLLIPIAYFAVFHATTGGRTAGKGAFGIAVRTVDGGPVDLLRAAGRAGIQTLLWLTVIGGIVDALAPLWDDESRALHDHAAGTIVVRVR